MKQAAPSSPQKGDEPAAEAGLAARLSSDMRVDVLPPDAPGWSAALAHLRHDAYHLPAYVEFASRRQEAGQPLAFIAEEGDQRFFVPLIVREVPADVASQGTLFDATCPRGYPGPLVALTPGAEGEGFLERAIDAFVATMRERSVVAVYGRLHPLLLPPLAELRRVGPLVEHGASVSIDLSRSPEDLWRQTRENHRRDITRSIRRGIVARIDESWERFDGFVDAYQESMDRLGARPFWRLTREYFADPRETLGDCVHLCVVERNGVLAAAGMLTEVDGIVEYHLAGTFDAFVGDSPSKLLIHFARGWAQERGHRVLHLAGSLRSGDPLHHFKAGFSPTSHPVYSWRVVSDDATYRTLVERWEAGRRATADPIDGYFPAYRKDDPGIHDAG